MDNNQSVNGSLSYLESEEIVAVVTSVFSRRIRNCNAVNGKDALTSAILKEKKQKRKKNDVRRKGKYEATNLENGVPDLKTVLIYNNVSAEVCAGSKEQEDVKKQRKIMRCKERRVPDMKRFSVFNDVSTETNAGSKEQDDKKKIKILKRKETSFVQRSSSHSPAQQNGRVREPCSVISHKGENANISGKEAKNLLSQSQNKRKEMYTFDRYLSASAVKAGLAENVLIKGTIRINQKNFKEAYVSSPDKGKDILIEGVRDRNRALEGDEVVLKLNPKSEWKAQDSEKQKTAKVVYILKKIHPRIAVGFLKPMTDKNESFALFSPRDSRIPRMRIPIAKCPEDFLVDAKKYKDILYLACIQSWKSAHFIQGDLVREVGVSGDLKSESMAILLENDIDISPYDAQLYQCFSHSEFQIPEEELRSRADLRNECILTIDPPTARDLDDAMSCKKLDNGNFLVGVHIADVSYFLEEGTPLDQAVARKATSTYVVESVYHMLPREMCTLCSLLPGVDKLAFTVFWEMSPEAEVVRYYFTRSVINSCAQLSYQHVKIMLENPDKQWNKDELPQIYGKYSPEDLIHVLNNLNHLAIIMRGKRLADGALMFQQPKLTFTLENGSGLPLEYSLYVSSESHRVVEEFMLLANVTVAKQLAMDFPRLAFLRCHPTPQLYILKEFQMAMEERGIFIDTSSARGLQTSMYQCGGDDPNGRARMLVLNSLCARTMSRAKYMCAQFEDSEEDCWHYGLNVPLYTHFTSPIRRYADVMVHRLLCASLGYSPEPNWRPDYVQNVATNCNKRKYRAKRAGEQSVDLYLTFYIGLRGPLIEEAVVMDVKDLSFDVIICSMGLIQRIYTNNLPFPSKVTHREENNKVVAQEIEWLPTDEEPSGTRLVVEIFSIVRVELSRSAPSLKVESRLLRPSVSGEVST